MSIAIIPAVDDAAAILSWIAPESKPTSFVTGAEGTASFFYLNKILVAYKGTDHVEKNKAFVDGMNGLLAYMRTYIKTHFPTGLH